MATHKNAYIAMYGKLKTLAKIYGYSCRLFEGIHTTLSDVLQNLNINGRSTTT